MLQTWHASELCQTQLLHTSTPTPASTRTQMCTHMLNHTPTLLYMELPSTYEQSPQVPNQPTAQAAHTCWARPLYAGTPSAKQWKSCRRPGNMPKIRPLLWPVYCSKGLQRSLESHPNACYAIEGRLKQQPRQNAANIHCYQQATLHPSRCMVRCCCPAEML